MMSKGNPTPPRQYPQESFLRGAWAKEFLRESRLEAPI